MMTIGQVAQALGLKAKMIRYYETMGLIKSAQRSRSGYRLYSTQDLRVLGFIQQSRGLGFSIKQIADLLDLWQDQQRSSVEVKQLAQKHLQAINKRMEALSSIQRSLQDLIEHCHGDERPDCPILDSLGAEDKPSSATISLNNLKHSI